MIRVDPHDSPVLRADHHEENLRDKEKNPCILGISDAYFLEEKTELT